MDTIWKWVIGAGVVVAGTIGVLVVNAAKAATPAAPPATARSIYLERVGSAFDLGVQHNTQGLVTPELGAAYEWGNRSAAESNNDPADVKKQRSDCIASALYGWNDGVLGTTPMVIIQLPSGNTAAGALASAQAVYQAAYRAAYTRGAAAPVDIPVEFPV